MESGLAVWVTSNPGVAVLTALVVPVLLVVWSELRGGSPTGMPGPPAEARPHEAAPTPAPAVPVDAPVQTPVDRAPAPPVAEPEVAAPPVPEPEAPPPPPPVALRDRLRRTSDALVGRLGELLGGKSLDAELLDELELLLFGADLGVKTAESLLEVVRSSGGGKSADEVRFILKSAILDKLRKVEPSSGLALEGRPHVILVLGVNGAGKDTTIGKLAAQLHPREGKKVRPRCGAIPSAPPPPSSSTSGASARAAEVISRQARGATPPPSPSTR